MRKFYGSDGLFRKNAQRLLDKDAKLAHSERHWKKKELAEMKDRDWRIFKEDFSISAKGMNFDIIFNKERCRKVK